METVISFSVFNSWLTWKAVYGNKFRVGMYPWIGCKSPFKLSENMLDHVHLLNIHVLTNVFTYIQKVM